MRKKVLSIVTIATIVLFGSCNNEELLTESKPDTGHTLSFTASMPGENPTTRVGLEEKEDKSIELTWEETDMLELAFVQGDTQIKGTTTVTTISNGGKKAGFEIDIPEGINAEEAFDLYGVYGGGGLSNENPTNVILPTNPGEATSLADVKTRKDVMLYFETEINASNQNPTVTFKHLGSLFNITLKNNGSTSLDNLHEARLVGVDGDGAWADNAGSGGVIYNLVTKESSGTPGNYISFKAETNSLTAGNSITFWGWSPPLTPINWPALKLELRNATTPLMESSNTKPARSGLTQAGKNYYFNAEWNGTTLEWVDFGAIELKLELFSAIESDFYFYNLKAQDFSASIDELDIENKTLTLTYKETPTSAPTTATVGYSIYSKGIILNPAISYGTVEVDEIEFGELNDQALELVKVGNAGAGSMGYMHTAPYPLTMTTDRSIGTADWLMSSDFYGGIQIYTQNADVNYSDLVNVHRATLGAYLEANGTDVKTDTRLVHQLYFYNVTSTTPNNLQISTHKQSTTGNWFFPYRFTWDKVPGNSDQIKFNFYETFNLSVGLEPGLDEYLSHIFPEEGVTVMPVVVGTALRIRLISVKDSRIWGEYRINSATNRIPRFN